MLTSTKQLASSSDPVAGQHVVVGPSRTFFCGKQHGSSGYRASKRVFDVVISLILLPALLLAALVLLVLNPFMNRGTLFFVQERMGRGMTPFNAWKFRSMEEANVTRGAFDALDSHRITPLGRLLRESRIDELPQIFNVLRGEMSLIGPRPDYYPHACVYSEQVPGYRERCAMLPGITGYAQVEIGYVEGLEGLKAKIAADLHYQRLASLSFDLWITWRTVSVVLGRQGS
jgi:lipopolysaccharide/colanic/teichoic acid biosynthesis glycosyltransferase